MHTRLTTLKIMCKLEKIPHLLIYFFIGPSLKGTRTDAGLGKYFIDDKILVNCNNSKPSVKMVHLVVI